MLSRSTAVLVLLLGVSFTSANTEIVNFPAKYIYVATPIVDTWQTLKHGATEFRGSLPPAPRGSALAGVCEAVTAQPCAHEQWLTLDLDDPAWVRYSRFTLRVSWPGSSPADFRIDLYSPDALPLCMTSRPPSQPLPPADAATDAIPRTRITFARIRLVDTGVLTPSWPTSATNVSQMQDPGPDAAAAAVPFELILEPLLFGVLPASLVPTVVLIAAVALVAVLVGAPRASKHLERLARIARVELDPPRRPKMD